MSISITCERGHTFNQSAQSKRNKRGCPFCARKRAWPGETDIFTEIPNLEAKWDFGRNSGLDPKNVLRGSDKRAWWICEKGHRFEKSVYQMVKSGCSFCSNKQLLVGFNDLDSVRPDLSAQFDVSKNGGLSPRDLLFGTSKRVWWICENGHSFEARVSDRNFKNSGCGVCKGKRTVSGVNDLRTLHPRIAESWDEKRNSGLLPEDVSPTSNQKVWWKCAKGHSWIMRVGDRVTHAQGCAVCSNRQIVAGVNDLFTTHPEIASTLAPGLNQSDFASKVSPHSNKKAWWICPKGHEYQTTVAERQKKGCAICAGQKVLAGYNDLESQNPDAAARFVQGKNSLPPTEVLDSSRVKHWWECDLGHQFQANPDSVRKGNWCPYCGGKSLLPGFNDLESVRPDLAAEWHPDKNHPLLPSDVIYGFHRRVWWICSSGHEFLQSGKKRRVGQGCPTCSPSGFTPGRPAHLYFIENERLLAFKVGITGAESQSRLETFIKEGWVVHALFLFSKGKDAIKAEERFFHELRKVKSVPVFLSDLEMKRTGGWTETFSSEISSRRDVLRQLVSLCEEENGHLVAQVS